VDGQAALEALARVDDDERAVETVRPADAADDDPVAAQRVPPRAPRGDASPPEFRLDAEA
jgi:hypothetical protein